MPCIVGQPFSEKKIRQSFFLQISQSGTAPISNPPPQFKTFLKHDPFESEVVCGYMQGPGLVEHILSEVRQSSQKEYVIAKYKVLIVTIYYSYLNMQ